MLKIMKVYFLFSLHVQERPAHHGHSGSLADGGFISAHASGEAG